MSRGPGVSAMVGVCGSPGEQREGRGMGGDCAMGCVVSVYVSTRRGALAWSVVGLTPSRGGAGHGTLRVTRTGEQAGKALRSQGHHYARVM